MHVFYLTLVAAGRDLSAGALAQAIDYLAARGVAAAGEPVWLAPHKAADIPLCDRPAAVHLRDLRDMMAAGRVDVLVTPADGRRKRLLVADMDGTVIEGELIDELAARAGMKDEIAAITDRAMRGELAFEDALKARMALLKGLGEDALRATLADVRLTGGAETLVKTMTAQGASCVLISGGFTFFTEAVAARAGFGRHHGNDLEIAGGVLTGRVAEPILGRETKEALLREHAAARPEGLAGALALGDGANDLPMLQAAGLGIGFHPKPLLRDQLDNLILYGDLTAALYAQGYPEAEFAAA